MTRTRAKGQRLLARFKCCGVETNGQTGGAYCLTFLAYVVSIYGKW